MGVDQQVSFALFKETRDNLFKNHSQSLLTQRDRERLVKLSYYDYNINYKAKIARYTELGPKEMVSVRVGGRNDNGKIGLEAESSTSASSTVNNNGGLSGTVNANSDECVLLQIGRVTFKLFNQDWALFVFRTPDGGLLIPFRDPTNGVTTYAGGRYLYHTCEGADLGSNINSNGSIILSLDFNYAYNPPRCYNDLLGSLVPHQENSLNIKIEAGEKMLWEWK